MPVHWRAEGELTIFRKAVYLLFGVLLIPLCVGVGYSTIRQIIASDDLRQNVVFFFIGFVSYLTFFVAFRKPLRPYLLGHELTHALWVWLFRGKVRDIRLSSQRGQIKATKRNILIALAPYFFPFYTVLVMLGYWLVSLWVEFGLYRRLVVFVIGFTWSFHLLLNLFVLRRGQEDLRLSGGFFSLVVIFLFNFLIFGLIMVFVCDDLSLKGYLSKLTKDVLSFYTAVMRSTPP